MLFSLHLKYSALVILLCLCQLSLTELNAQTQLGQTINGVAMGETANRVALSADGNRMAIGAPFSLVGVIPTGRVRIYELQNDEWMQVGADILGKQPNDQYGTNMALSDDGKVIVIGSGESFINGVIFNITTVYEENNGTWEQLGEDITGDLPGDFSGISVDISGDGSKIAVGSGRYDEGTNSDVGQVKIFSWSNGNWNQLGNAIVGEETNALFGNEVSLSNTGNRIAVGAPFADGNGSFSNGNVSVYDLLNGQWQQLGENIGGIGGAVMAGASISLSDDGKRLAIGAPQGSSTGLYAGRVRVFEDMNGAWTQVGGIINGRNGGDYLGFSVDLSANGNVLVVGSPGGGDNSTGPRSGIVDIYSLVDSDWVATGDPVFGLNQGNYFGESIALSADGTRLAAGSRGINQDVQNNTGQVRVFETGTTVSFETQRDYRATISAYPNPTMTGTFTIVGIDMNTLNTSVNIYGTDGRRYQGQINSDGLISTNLATGVYSVFVKTSNELITTKLVVVRYD